jgi:hypothetical protein
LQPFFSYIEHQLAIPCSTAEIRANVLC